MVATAPNNVPLVTVGFVTEFYTTTRDGAVVLNIYEHQTVADKRAATIRGKHPSATFRVTETVPTNQHSKKEKFRDPVPGLPITKEYQIAVAQWRFQAESKIAIAKGEPVLQETPRYAYKKPSELRMQDLIAVCRVMCLMMTPGTSLRDVNEAVASIGGAEAMGNGHTYEEIVIRKAKAAIVAAGGVI